MGYFVLLGGQDDDAGPLADKKIPFKHIYLHGLKVGQRAAENVQIKGNVIDPLGVIDLYGADALRMALVVGNTRQ